jgi:hypothetical protein
MQWMPSERRQPLVSPARERGTAMIYASRFIPYRDRWCAADRRPKRRPSRSSSASLLQYRAL